MGLVLAFLPSCLATYLRLHVPTSNRKFLQHTVRCNACTKYASLIRKLNMPPHVVPIFPTTRQSPLGHDMTYIAASCLQQTKSILQKPLVAEKASRDAGLFLTRWELLHASMHNKVFTRHHDADWAPSDAILEEITNGRRAVNSLRLRRHDRSFGIYIGVPISASVLDIAQVGDQRGFARVIHEMFRLRHERVISWRWLCTRTSTDTVTVSDEFSLYKALINGNVTKIIISENIKLKSTFWGQIYKVVNITRNLTMEGSALDWESFVELDFGLIQSKVVLWDGAILTFRRLVLLDVFSRKQPSYDFFGASPSSSKIMMVEVVDRLTICIPFEPPGEQFSRVTVLRTPYTVPGWRAIPRIAAYPGEQNLTLSDEKFCPHTSSRCFSPLVRAWDWAINSSSGPNLLLANNNAQVVYSSRGTLPSTFGRFFDPGRSQTRDLPGAMDCIDEMGPDLCYVTSLQLMLGLDVLPEGQQTSKSVADQGLPRNTSQTSAGITRAPLTVNQMN
ncbi:hypothetical protein VOLCADRAFT_93204 [Volvox carteri f. nagariensis]|uniref:Uncharacterized protein n=1 Tax=Volvox carteri f. nagariensis TaxID=3068 RepID=D8U1K2_VOLCA|nr:uncharacterized protein VOLCADRAFT_93204 [Volvox carteri f. nagariensis]EFJ46354.1 hypothetical protein VOLCADRAFT_93204 [Volvox carteri f. nagariensis]|eukprot:XP_002952507.1 hypothetical protein VOLCADRAFT_93204 [Volvox carteri f. nagariensis]